MNVFTLLKISLVIFWACLFLLLLKRDIMVDSLELQEARVLLKSSEESFLGVYFHDERIGYVQNRFSPDKSGDILLAQKAYLLLNILNERQPVKLSGNAVLSSSYLLKEFSFRLEAPFYQMDVSGEVRDNVVYLSMNSGKQKISDRIHLKSPPFLSTNRRSYLISSSLVEGRKTKVPYFDPFTLSVQNSIVEYKGWEKTLIKGRVHNLHRFVESYAGIRVNSWLNDAGEVVKEESPAGFVFIAEPEFRAKDISKTAKEVLSAVSAPIIGEMPDLSGRRIMKYKLTLPKDAEFDIDKDRQSLVGEILTLSLETVPGEEAMVCSGEEKQLAETPYVQTNHKDIINRLAALDVGGMAPLRRVEVIAGWVYDNLEKRPVIGIPDAVTTLKNLRGDCNEHASLFAALARSAGIPARIVAGVTLHDGSFYYHAWNEVCLGDAWISLDTTVNQIPADLGHIKFVEGETQEQVRIGALLGNLLIEVVE